MSLLVFFCLISANVNFANIYLDTEMSAVYSREWMRSSNSNDPLQVLHRLCRFACHFLSKKYLYTYHITIFLIFQALFYINKKFTNTEHECWTISFHDKAAVLDEILTEYPQVEVVQIQFNYVDYEDASIESRKCYEVCEKHGKPVIVMESVNGGSLVNLPEDADKILRGLNGGSNASYAIRFAASFPNVMMVLSGMGNMEMMTENIGFMKDFVPLNDAEKKAIAQVCEIFRSQNLIPCTACRYCMEQCPKHIAIPDLFACLNAKKQFQNWNTDYYYNNIHTKNGGKASDCIKCGKCEQICPQHLEIRKLLTEVANEFDRK